MDRPSTTASGAPAPERAEETDLSRARVYRRRKGRDQCSAHRKDGQRCRASAIEGGTVCRVHGGSAPQVAFAARRRVLLERLARAQQAWRDGPHRQPMSTGEVFALGWIAIAERALQQHDSDMLLIKLMQAELMEPTPKTTAMLLDWARERLARPWN